MAGSTLLSLSAEYTNLSTIQLSQVGPSKLISLKNQPSVLGQEGTTHMYTSMSVRPKDFLPSTDDHAGNAQQL
jgi:hypothetical protein